MVNILWYPQMFFLQLELTITYIRVWLTIFNKIPKTIYRKVEIGCHVTLKHVFPDKTAFSLIRILPYIFLQKMIFLAKWTYTHVIKLTYANIHMFYQWIGCLALLFLLRFSFCFIYNLHFILFVFLCNKTSLSISFSKKSFNSCIFFWYLLQRWAETHKQNITQFIYTYKSIINVNSYARYGLKGKKSHCYF